MPSAMRSATARGALTLMSWKLPLILGANLFSLLKLLSQLH